ncbi:MAG: hypothetical protein JWO94_3438 [Verrucomicrobiaceae bacterium]|nr:hypothetical protein [Verrucomicrobiaceae bacterium]
MRKALVVGIDYYTHISPLHGCVNDAHSVKAVLERNSDGSVNFGVKILSGTGPADSVSRESLKYSIRDLFADDNEIALLFFAGHGHIETTGGYLCSSDCKTGDDGIPLSEILTFANKSRARNKIIVLDSCYSGIAGANATSSQMSELSEGMTILTASTESQYATEINGSGVFTSLFVDALSGAAGNLIGQVTPGSVYAHIDQSLGEWDQRPIFKTNIKKFVSLRTVQPPLTLAELQKIKDFFPSAGFEFKLDPSFEPERAQQSDVTLPLPDPVNTQNFALLQRYNRVNLVVPVDAPHMWHAAMNSKACKLRVLGEHYRRLVISDRI